MRINLNLNLDVTDVPDGTYTPARAEHPDTDGTTEDYTLHREEFEHGYAVGGYLGGVKVDPDQGPSQTARDTLPVLLAEAYRQGHHVGVWTDTRTGIVYYDAVRVHRTKDSAMRAARLHGELAIWDMAANEEVWVA